MIRVVQRQRVAKSLSDLRSQRTHPNFAGYLHLLQQARELGRIVNLPPKFLPFFERFFRVKDHPIGTPYIKPFTQKASDLWLNENVAGSYAPSSFREGKPFSKVVLSASPEAYSLYADHT